MNRSSLILIAALALLVLPGPPPRAEVRLNEVLSCNVGPFADEDGDYKDWVELHNTGPAPVDLAGYGLSDDGADLFKWIIPARTLEPGGYLLLFASGKDRVGAELHTSFGLDAYGEPVFLTTPAGQVADLVVTPFMPASISCGRVPGDETGLFYFDSPTPGGPNDGAAYTGIAGAPAISPEGSLAKGTGAFDAVVTDPGGQAALTTWTTGGAEPTEADTPYTAPIPITQTTVLRARNFEPGKLPSPIVTRTWLFAEPGALPAVSIVTDPAHLWDTETGIYVLGDDYDPHTPYYGANFWEDWERPAHLEYFAEPGAATWELDLGIKIHGNMSRALPQKSLRLLTRKGYGTHSIERRLFSERDLADYQRLILRNAANDWCRAHMRDAFAQSAAGRLGLDFQAWVPTEVFLNGEYWGIHNLRDHEGKRYLETHYGWEEYEVDILESDGTSNYVMAGDNVHYTALMDFLEANSLADSAAYAYVGTQMEIDNFAFYNIVEIFFGNLDWPRNNRRYWRPRASDGRWRWFLIDLDYSTGLDEDAAFDYLDRATHETGTSSQNPPWATLMLRRLLENDGFRRDFINRYADLLNTDFSAATLLARLDAARERLLPASERHMARWGYVWERWDNAVADMAEFLTERPAHARDHIRQKFALPDTVTLSLAIDPPGGGAVDLTAASIDTAWSGVYFVGNPVPLTARAAPGFAFAGWSDPELPREPAVVVDLAAARHVTALFAETGGAARLVINEINYNSADAFDPGDWVELWNAGDAPLALAGWSFGDGDDQHRFDLPHLTLPADGALVLCDDLAAFTALFPEVAPVAGDLGFGFSGGGERLRLFDPSGQLHDSVLYDDGAPWPTAPDGGGPTLELQHPLLDNALAANWSASASQAPHGTPGARNSVYSATPVSETTPAADRLERPWPNPCNPSVRIAFSLAAAGPCRLTIHDIRGRLVRELKSDPRHPAGFHTVTWNGRDDAGRPAPTGLYLTRLATADGTKTHKVTLLK